MTTVAVTGPAIAAPDSDVAPHRTWARRAAAAAVPICYLLAAMLLTRRLWSDPASRFVAGNFHDADQAAWFMRYAATAVRHGHLPALVTKGLNAPAGVNLMWNTPMLLADVVLAPVTVLAGPQVSLTILTTAGFAGSATALFWVLRRWDVSIPAAALAGAVYGFSPALLQSALSHYDLELAILPPLIIDAGLRLTVGPAVPRSRPADPPASRLARWLAYVPGWARSGRRLGLLVAAQLFIDEELLLVTALTGILVVLVLALSRPRTAVQRALPTAAGLVVAAGVALVLAGFALHTQFSGPLVMHGPPYQPDKYVNDLTTFVTPQSALFFHTAASAAAAARYKGGAPEYLGYLGWPLIAALAVAAVATWRKLAGRVTAVALVALCVCSLGGHPLIAGTTYPAVDLPWHWVEEYSILDAALPDRLSILADGAAAALLAVGIDAVRAGLKARRPFGRRLVRLAGQLPFWRRLVRLAGQLPFWRPLGRLAGHLPLRMRSGRPAAQRQFSDALARLAAQRQFPQRPARLAAAQMAVVAVAVACCLPLLPRPLPESSTPPLPAGWSAVFAGLHVGPDTRVLVLPLPGFTVTQPMRWSADSGEPSQMVGGYFVAPGNGQAQVGDLIGRRMPAYLNYLWSLSVPPGSPYGSTATKAYVHWAGFHRQTLTPRTLIGPVVHVTAVLTALAYWRPQAVVADASADSPLGLYLTKALGPPTVTVDGVSGWQLAGKSWPDTNTAVAHAEVYRSCGHVGQPRPGCHPAT